MKRMFPAELRTASVVPRWSIVWTLTRDTVSNHSFFVTFYARQIAVLIGWDVIKRQINDHRAMEDLMYYAMTHDLDETITGDIVSPVKREIVDDERASDFIAAQMDERLTTVVDVLEDMFDRSGGKSRMAEIRAIVKAADRLDALLFLTVERRMGNGVISPRLEPMWNMLEAAWMKLPAGKDELQKLYNTAVVPAVKEHETTGGFGL